MYVTVEFTEIIKVGQWKKIRYQHLHSFFYWLVSSAFHGISYTNTGSPMRSKINNAMAKKTLSTSPEPLISWSFFILRTLSFGFYEDHLTKGSRRRLPVFRVESGFHKLHKASKENFRHNVTQKANSNIRRKIKSKEHPSFHPQNLSDSHF